MQVLEQHACGGYSQGPIDSCAWAASIDQQVAVAYGQQQGAARLSIFNTRLEMLWDREEVASHLTWTFALAYISADQQIKTARIPGFIDCLTEHARRLQSGSPDAAWSSCVRAGSSQPMHSCSRAWLAKATAGTC